MLRIARYTDRLIRALAGAPLDRVGDGDTTAAEVSSLRAALGDRLPALLARAGLAQLDGRADLERLQAALKARGI
jgi:hypothetical protein